jgi:hypothetical protein
MTDGFTYPTGRGPQAEDDLRLHQLPRDQRYCLAQEVIRLAGEHARNDIGTVMLWPSASVVLLSSIDCVDRRVRRPRWPELPSARLRKRRYTTSTDMTVPGCSTRRVPLLDRRMLKKPLAGRGYGSQRPLR